MDGLVTMKWLKKLYVSPTIEKKKQKIKWKLNHFAGVAGLYIIVLPEDTSCQLEIIESVYLKQHYYRKRNMIIVGIADSQINAFDIILQITKETYENNNDANIKRYLLEKYDNKKL